MAEKQSENVSIVMILQICNSLFKFGKNKTTNLEFPCFKCITDNFL